MEATRVEEAMTNLVLTVRPEEKIGDASKRLIANRISGAPVVEGGRLVGVVSEADFLRAGGPWDQRCVREVMSTKVISVEPEASIWKAADLIDRFGVRRLPVVDDEGWVVGILTRSDLVRCMAKSRSYA